MDLPRLRQPRLMGILNITGDSFSDGGRYLNPDQALLQAQAMVRDGATIIDVGGESTRPGSEPVPAEVELARVIPVLARLRQLWPELDISVDTRKSEVAQAAIELGAAYINDVSALRADPALAPLLASNPSVKVILMHMQGEPASMQAAPHYGDVVAEVCEFFRERIAFAESVGISQDRLLLDPGIGFGKDLDHNLTLLSHLDSFRSFGLPLVLGVSRKRFIDALDPSAPDQRLGGTLAAAMVCALQKVDILRVHDVKEHRQFFAVLAGLAEAAWIS